MLLGGKKKRCFGPVSLKNTGLMDATQAPWLHTLLVFLICSLYVVSVGRRASVSGVSQAGGPLFH